MDKLTLLILIVGFLIFISYTYPNTLENFIPDRILQLQSGTYSLQNYDLTGTKITIKFNKAYSIERKYNQPNNIPYVFMSTTLDSSYVATIISITTKDFTVIIRKLPVNINTTECKIHISQYAINWIAFIVNKDRI